MYVDPSGHDFGLSAILIGAAIGALVSGATSDWDPQAMAIGSVIGGVSGGVFSGVEGAVAGAIKGTVANATIAGAISGAAGGAAAGAVAGGMSAGIYGGDIGSGMLRGAGLGAVGGAAFGGIGGYFGKTWNLYRVGAYTLAGGGVSELAGQGFEKGAMFAGITALARFTYNEIVSYDVTWEPGGEAVEKDPAAMPCYGCNNVGTAGKLNPDGLFNEGGRVSRAANHIPGVNATAGLHDVFQVKLDEWLGSIGREILNVPGMIPAAAITGAGLMSDPRAMMLYAIEPDRDR